MMVFSYLEVAFDISKDDIQLFEEDSGFEIEEMEDRVFNLRDEAIKKATLLKEIYSLFRKGSTNK